MFTLSGFLLHHIKWYSTTFGIGVFSLILLALTSMVNEIWAHIHELVKFEVGSMVD